MFIGMKRMLKNLAPLGAKPGSITIATRENGCAPTERGAKKKGRLAINISPRWGEATNNPQLQFEFESQTNSLLYRFP